MLRRKKTKAFALLLSVAMAVLVPSGIPARSVGLYEGCSLACRLAYPFFHAGWVHLALNLWCFLSCVFVAEVPASVLLAAYFISATVPATSPVPTVGLSGVCFALLGFLMWRSGDKLSYNLYVAAGVALPWLLLPGAVDSIAHVWCYLSAVALGALVRIRRLH